ncbi:hypothetical protein MMC12_008712 [Toensbergia leucococca]|nr:hypothetical protein [Toensbergia leucococca]
MASPKRSCFLDLPRELRDQIYFHALVCRDDGGSVYRSPHTAYYPPSPGLALVNRQIHDEANQTLYSVNRFYLWSVPSSRIFFSMIGPTNTSYIRHLSISVLGQDEPWAQILDCEDLTHITSLDIAAPLTAYAAIWIFYSNQLEPKIVEAVLRLFTRNENKSFVPCLRLTGLDPRERRRFPESWDVEVDWD